MTSALVRRLAVVLTLAATFVGLGATDAHAANVVAANNFNNAPLLPAGNGAYTGHTALATRQAGEPDHGEDGEGGGATVWYRYRRGTTADVRLTLQGSNFDTVLAVYRGNSLTNLVEVAANDDADIPGALWSMVEFEAKRNVTYRIVIDGYNDYDDFAERFDTRRGRYRLHVTRLTGSPTGDRP